jgi:hypothetical protein
MTHRTIGKVVTVFALLAALGLQAACASDSGSTEAGSGGAPGLGGTLGGGSGGTTGGQDMTVGGGTPRPCTASETIVAPANGLIADFTEPDGGINVVGGGILAYPVGSTTAPTYTTSGGSLHITLDRPATSAPQYLGVVLAGHNRCVDATAFTGVQFTISGSFSGCTMHYYANDDAHQDVTSGAPRASGPEGSYPPQTAIPANEITAMPRTMKMPFSGQSGGSPATPVDPARLIIVGGWQFDVDASTSSVPGSCMADLTIDDVRFY